MLFSYSLANPAASCEECALYPIHKIWAGAAQNSFCIDTIVPIPIGIKKRIAAYIISVHPNACIKNDAEAGMETEKRFI